MSLLKASRYLMTPINQTTRPASAAMKRSVERSVDPMSIPTFNSSAEIFSYADSHLAKMNPSDVVSFMGRADITASRSANSLREMREHPGFQKLVDAGSDAITSASKDQVGNILFRLAALDTFNRHPQMRSASEKVLQRIINREIPIDSETFGSLLDGLSRFDAVDIRVLAFLEEELPKLVPSMPVPQCRRLLIAMHRLKFRNPQVDRLIRDKLTAAMDQFGNGDVVATLRVMATTGFSCNELLQRCTDLLQQHAALFDVEEILTSAESLIRIGRMNVACGRAMVEELKRNGRALRGPLQSRTLRILQRAAPLDATFADELVGLQLTSSAPKTYEQQCILAHSICYFGLESRKTALKTLMDGLLARDNYPSIRLQMLMEAVEGCNQKMAMKIGMPENLKSAWEQFAMAQRAPPPYMTEMLEGMPETHRFDFERRQPIGPFYLSYVDKAAKVAIQVVDTPPLHGRRLLNQIINNYGYTVVHVSVSALQRVSLARRPEVLQQILNPLAISAGRITPEEAAAQRATRQS